MLGQLTNVHPTPDAGSTDWLQRFAPTRADELATPNHIVAQTSAALQRGRVVLFSGPPGSCKTTTISVLCTQYQIDLTVVDAAQHGSLKLQSVVRGVATAALGPVHAVAIENADVLAATSETIAWIKQRASKENYNPIVFVVQDRYSAAAKRIASVATDDVRFPPVSRARLEYAVALSIHRAGLSMTADALQAIVEYSGGDLRKALIEAEWECRVDSRNCPTEKRAPRNAFEATERVFAASSSNEDPVDIVLADRHVRTAFLAENATRRCGNLCQVQTMIEALSADDAMRFADGGAAGVAYAAMQVRRRSGRVTFPSKAAFGSHPTITKPHKTLYNHLHADVVNFFVVPVAKSAAALPRVPARSIPAEVVKVACVSAATARTRSALAVAGYAVYKPAHMRPNMLQ